MVRAKFKCESKLLTESGVQVRLTPACGGSPENEEFFRYTPSGEIKMGILNPAAAEQFTPGKEYYVDFTPTEK